MFRSNLQPDVRRRDGGWRGRRVSLGRSSHRQFHHRPGAHRRGGRLLPPTVYHQAPDLPGKNGRFKHRYLPLYLFLLLFTVYVHYTLICDLVYSALPFTYFSIKYKNVWQL